MNKSDATFHARKRMQQRGVSGIQLQLLEILGVVRLQKGGSSVLEIEHKTLTALRTSIEWMACIHINGNDKSDATLHASKRKQQRGVSEVQMMLLEKFGTARLQRDGGFVQWIESKTLSALRAAVDRLANIQVILGESDKVITVQHCHKKIRATQYVA